MADEFILTPAEYGARGGRRRAALLEPERRREIARLGAERRWHNLDDLPRATHDGELKIGDATIQCAVLEDKRRVLTQSDVMRALGRARQAKGRQYYDGDVNLPVFLTAKNLKPFVPNDLYVTSSQIEFRRKNGGRAFGYAAELLPKICAVFNEANAARRLTKHQNHIAERARILLHGFAEIGIIALIDEATGYQEERDRNELQRILAAYISQEFLPWSERFPLEYYKQMFRLWNWAWPPADHGRSGPLGPRYAGKLTNKLVYDKLPPGVPEELRRRSPPDQKWQRRDRLHQHLSEGIGQPHLEKQVAVVTGIMKVCDSKDEFVQKFDKAFPGTFNMDDGQLTFIKELKNR